MSWIKKKLETFQKKSTIIYKEKDNIFFAGKTMNRIPISTWLQGALPLKKERTKHHGQVRWGIFCLRP